MAQMRFMFLLVVLLFTACLSINHHVHQDGNAELTKLNVTEIGKGILDGDQIGGRKMGFNGVMRLQNLRKIGAIGKNSRIPSANGKCDVVNCKQPDGHFSEEAEGGGFVAFNADYHSARHHPPKNN